MPTKVDARMQAILDRGNQQLAGTATGTPVDAHMQAILDRGNQQTANLQPPAPLTQMPSPQAAPTYPQPVMAGRYPLAPNGRVIDPTTGEPFGKPGEVAHENPKPTLAQQAIEGVNTAGIVTGKVMHPVIRVLSAIINPLEAAAQSAFQQTDKEAWDSSNHPEVPFPARLAHNAAALGKNLLHSGPAAAAAATSPDIASTDPFSLPGIKNKQLLPGVTPGSTVDQYLRGGLNAATSMVVGELGGPIQGALVTRGMGLAGKGLQKAGALDAVIPGIGKSINGLKQDAGITQESARLLSKAQGASGQIQTEARGAIEGARKTYADLARKGVNLVGQSQDGRRVNAIDEYVYHWIEAGQKGAKYTDRAQALADAAALGHSPEQAQLIRQAVQKIGTDYTNAWQRVGRHLEAVGYLKPGTVQKMGGQYVAYMYHAASHNAGDIEAWLDTAAQHGFLTPEAERLGTELLGRRAVGRAAGGINPSKARKGYTFAERQALGGEFQASPIFTKSLSRDTQIAGKLGALKLIAAHPDLASDVPQAGWLKIPEGGFGELGGKYVPPAVAHFLKNSFQTDQVNNPALKALAWVSGVVKSNITTLNLPMIMHKAKFDQVLSEGTAASEGVAFTPAMVKRAAIARKAWLKSGQAPPAIQALMDETRAFTPGGSSVGDLGKSLGASLGIETTGQKIVAGAEKLKNATRQGIGAVEQTYKIALTEALAKKYGYAKAAQIAHETISGDHMTSYIANAAIRAVEKYGGIPFVTARSKAAPLMLKIALENPQILRRWSGVDVAQGMASAIGPEAKIRQQIAGDPTAIPIPGMKDRYGRQRLLTTNPLEVNPATDLQHLGAGVGGAASSIASGLLNTDFSRGFATGKFEPIVKPGAMPPDMARQARLDYVTGRTGPGLFTRGIPGIGRAISGTTQYGGASQEPESVTEAAIRALTGARLTTPETMDEKGRRMQTNQDERSANQRFLDQYQSALARGEVTPSDHTQWPTPDNPRDMAEWYKNAFFNLQSVVQGAQEKPGSLAAQAKIRRLADWLHYLEGKLSEVGGSQDELAQALSQAMAGEQ